jgi:superfamily II DNA or RNA helicase
MSENYKRIIRELPTTFDTEDDQKIGKELNSPCIQGSYLYQRLTGDLTSNFLKILTEDCVKDLLKTEEGICRIEFVTHMTLEEADKNTLETYLKNRSNLEEYLESLMTRSVEKYLTDANPEIDRQSRLDIFATLVAKKTIIIKFAFPKKPRSIFHKKTGIFHFDWGDKISFIGGHNDTIGGLENNIEELELRKSWIGENDIDIITKREKTFYNAWNNKSLNFITRPLSLKNLDRLTTRPERRFQKNINKIIPKSENENPKPKDDKWSFQEDAVNIFLEKKAGILEMATGTGKTRTTFKILGKLLDQKKINKIIIQMQGTELIDQWTKELDDWRHDRDELMQTYKQNQDAKEQEMFLANFKNDDIDILFVSQKSLSNLLEKLNSENLTKTIIIHDEIHNLPTDNMISKIKGLQKNIAYRLGLSATVNDAYDVTRDDRLFAEVGPIIFRFDIEQAIKRGILVEFDVEYIYYKLTETEKKERKGWMVWREQQIKLKQISQQEIDERFSRGVSLIFKKAQNKIQLLDDYINNNKHTLEKCFIFAQEMDYGDLILNRLIKYMPEIKTHYDKHADKDNLVEFAKGNLKCIINCKKLNEGINMKSLSNIILVSSEGKRQLIQRLGRVLRIDEENNPDKRAFVLDFINDEQKENMDGADFRRYEELNKLTKIRKSN